MGFHEYDRIRRKNAKYNYPTADINHQARLLLESLFRELPDASGHLSKHYIQTELKHSEEDIPKDVLNCALWLLENHL